MATLLASFLIFLALLNEQASAFQHYDCVFDKKYNAPGPKPYSWAKPAQVYTSEDLKRRGLAAITRNPIRITLDTTEFNTVKNSANSEPKTTATKLAFIKRTMLVAQKFYETRLKVSTIARVFAPSWCQDFGPPTNDVNSGISSSDLHIYVKYITDSTEPYGATGVACWWVNSLLLPDGTLQQGRPTIGRIIFNTYKLTDSETSLTSRLFASITSTALHETMHILGFDSSRYETYLDENTGNVYGSNNYLLENQNLHSSRTGGTNDILITPNVKQWAISFFACGSLDGMALENEDGAADVGSHWERLAMYDELMTGTQLGAQKGFSGLTFALLKDMGWYEVDETFSENNNYGYHMGCDFYNSACYFSPPRYPGYDDHFCDMTAYSGVSTCASNFMSKAVCNNTGAMTDGCGIYGGYFNCVDPATSDDGYKSYTLEKYQTDSFCVHSTLANVGISELYRGRCYPHICYATAIHFTVGTNTVICTYNPPINDTGDPKTIGTLNGYLICPDYTSFCEQSRQICPNWCSQNGFCTRGVCNCLTGYFGEDCSKTSCTTGQFYDKTANSCVNSCPSGTYENKYSWACLPCASNCNECLGQPDICTGCRSTPQQTLYFDVSTATCVDACPSDTYENNLNCYACSTVANCATCSLSNTNCTSCLNNLFLENPLTGSCVSVCTTGATLYDVVNHLCVSGCTGNLIFYTGGCADCPPGTDGICDLCASGTYKYILGQSCVPDCLPTYYKNDLTRFCETCDTSCLECDGAYAENCTACNPAKAEKYLLLKMCVSACPRGYSANDNAGACELCLVELNCATCLVYNTTSGAVRCQTCAYGYYLKESDMTCNLHCDYGYFKNTWNHSCDACPSACEECSAYSESSCLTCASDKKFLANVSGGYCLSACPTEYYTESGSNCLDCYLTCKTCDGVSSSSCLTCIDGLFLSAGMCRYVCPSGEYPNPDTGSCEICNRRCTFCFGPTVDNCTACDSGLVLNNFTCTTHCPQNLTLNQWGVCWEPCLSSLMLSLFAIILTNVL